MVSSLSSQQQQQQPPHIMLLERERSNIRIGNLLKQFQAVEAQMRALKVKIQRLEARLKQSSSSSSSSSSSVVVGRDEFYE